jgi:glycosyltransferase involved in cell wall biosynthesis
MNVGGGIADTRPHYWVTRERDVPLVSVIIPTYNRAEYVIQAVKSALAQTYPNFEIIVVDDGSTDDTEGVLRSYTGLIRYICQDNQGEGAARNTAIRASTGQYIALLDSDDVWLPDKLLLQMAFLRDHPEVGLVAGGAAILGRDGTEATAQALHLEQTETFVPFEQVLFNSPLTASTVVVRRECLPNGRPFTEGLRFGADWEMCLRVALEHHIGYVGHIVAYIRQHDGNVTSPLAGQEQIDTRLSNRLRVIDSVLPRLPNEPSEIASLRARAEAREYAETAVPSYVNGSWRIGAERLASSIQLDPATWQGGAELVDLIVHYANVVAEHRCEQDAWNYLRALINSLPPALEDPAQLRGRVWANTHAALTFKYYDRRKFAEAVPHAVRAMVHDRRWLRNRGMLAILGRSLVRGLRRSATEDLAQAG